MADYVGRHRLEPDSDGEYSIAELFKHQYMFAWIPRRVQNDPRNFPGYHASPWLKASYALQQEMEDRK